MMIKAKHKPARRGVVLLIILFLLAMFAMIGIAFLLVAGYHKRTARAYHRVGQQHYPAQEETHQAALQVLRGTDNERSVLRPHSLLEDEYGNRSVRGVIVADPGVPLVVRGICGGQIIEFTVPVGFPDPERWVGCVLTMLEGPAALRSTRIVGYVPFDPSAVPGQSNLLQILAFDEVPTAYFVNDFILPQNQGRPRRYLINGVPFSGTGFGFHARSGSFVLNALAPPGEDLDGDGNLDVPEDTNGNGILDPGEDVDGDGKLDLFAEDYNGNSALDAGPEYALIPNPVFMRPSRHFGYYVDEDANGNGVLDPGEDINGNGRLDVADPSGPGGANEDYDAVDYQNMLLAMVLPGEDLDGDGNLDVNEDVNGNGVLDAGEDIDGDGRLDVAEDRNGNGSLDPDIVPIPSLHRPALVNYWMAQTGSASWQALQTNFPAVARAISLRPSGGPAGDHPNFDGSNPNFDPRNGPWDVDTDGNGIPDSIWVDLGFEVRTAPDGRRYKPLFAILCVDLDGRLNLNAHGSAAQLVAAYYGPANGANTAGPPSVYAGGAPAVLLPRGQGDGPAEINLIPLFANLNRYQRLLWGDSGLGLEGRYGELAAGTPGPGWTAGPLMGEDPLSYNKHFPFLLAPLDPVDFNYFFSVASPPGQLTGFGTPADMRGGLAVGVDLRGQPIYRVMDAAPPGNDAADWNRAGVNDPYELDLSRNRARGLTTSAPIDNPFAANELEAILRGYDVDAPLLPRRLLNLIQEPGWSWGARRHQITTESWDPPAPNLALSPELRNALVPSKLAHDVTDLLRAKNPALTAQMMADLLPPELLAGRRLDLNCPVGNARDDNSNQVVDDPDEARMGLPPDARPPEMLTQITPGGPVQVPFDHDNNGVPGSGEPNNPMDPRLLCARHLYVLMMLLSDERWYPAGTTPAPPPNLPARARAIAQWAINVVEFRDRDAIMTPFEFDLNPFVDDDPADTNGDGNPFNDSPWNVNGRIGPLDGLDINGDGDMADPNEAPDDGQPYRGLVWGCERPELLITETLAFHDRKTEDLDTDDGDADFVAGADNDFDQRWRPQGSFYLELLNPWSADEAKAGELCFDRSDPNPANWTWRGGVVLNQRTPPVVAGGPTYPVFRLAIVGETNSVHMTLDPDVDEDLNNNGFLDPGEDFNRNGVLDAPINIDRSVYFTDPSSLPPGSDGFRYYTSAAGPIVIGHNRYAVIGPGQPGAAAPHVTFVGRETGGNPGVTRRIVLDPTAARQVEVFGDGNQNDLDRPGETQGAIRGPVAVVIDQPRRLSVSEPTAGYPANDSLGNPYDPAAGYLTPYDAPFDAAPLSIDATDCRHRVVHLQRLANPLLPFNAQTNPYLTIDSMQIDMTAFNGVTNDVDPLANAGANPYYFFTRERGETANTTPGLNNLWTQEPWYDATAGVTPPVGTLPRTVANHYFEEDFAHTLGYLNEPFGLPRPAPAGYIGDPQGNPFPWFSWINRPFISESELLLVPKLRSSALLGMFGMPPAPALDPYTTPRATFPHLLNFFYANPSAGNPPPGHFYRLLEYVQVPSRFVGTELQANPVAFTGNATGRHVFHPPFNGISRYRDPGRMNVNTIFSQEGYQGLMNGFPGLSALTFWRDNFIISRRGYGSAGANAVTEMLQMNPAYPTRFANPFRSFAGRDLVPTAGLQSLMREGVDATLLRRDVPVASSTRPLLDSTVGMSNPFNDPSRQPFFRYQALQRLKNLVTTRSNVYAVWITAGYFEVEEWAGGRDAAHPDGYALGRELGSDTGDIKRHRAFYIIDRSIPVGFERGEDHNVEDAILLKRFIE